MKVLITGVSGFAGSHLAEYVLSLGHEVTGTIRTRSPLENLTAVQDRIKLATCELTDPHSVRRLFADYSPDCVFHLAAQSFVQASWNHPEQTMMNNIVSQLNLLEAIRERGFNPMFLVAGSSEEYGKVRLNDFPITEAIPLKPLSPYGVSKVAQDLLGYQYHQSYGLNIIRTRAFNHTGPRRGEVFVTSNFAKQIVEIERGEREAVIKVGNLDAERDFTDVRDVVRAYFAILQDGRPGDVYNIASGKARTIASVLDMLISISKVKVKIEVDKSRLRPSDLPKLEGSYEKVKSAVGWQPTISFEQTMADLLDWWRARFRAGYRPSEQRH
ncbi:MAG: GDP-mannose 4,6-dehydratase [bacterium]|jgi:GDP-4-dehydro-6-deoxy-D-mannose reductase